MIPAHLILSGTGTIPRSSISRRSMLPFPHQSLRSRHHNKRWMSSNLSTLGTKERAIVWCVQPGGSSWRLRMFLGRKGVLGDEAGAPWLDHIYSQAGHPHFQLLLEKTHSKCNYSPKAGLHMTGWFIGTRSMFRGQTRFPSSSFSWRRLLCLKQWHPAIASALL